MIWLGRRHGDGPVGAFGFGEDDLIAHFGRLESPDTGSFLIDGKNATYWGPCGRRVGMMFANDALFGHMTVFDNIAFGLRVLPSRVRPLRWEIDTKVRDLVHRMRLAGRESHLPSQLSAFERRRVALARSLAVESALLLLDEPLANVEAEARAGWRRWLRELLRERGIAVVMATEDAEDAIRVADVVVPMNQGRVQPAMWIREGTRGRVVSLRVHPSLPSHMP